jgi:hypothetical protein
MERTDIGIIFCNRSLATTLFLFYGPLFFAIRVKITFGPLLEFSMFTAFVISMLVSKVEIPIYRSID